MILLPRLLLTAFFAVMAAPSLALACSNPSGDAGDQIYNTTHNVMQYCNGTAWVAMGTSGAMVGDSLGNHAASEDLHMNGFKIIGLGAPLDGTDAATKGYVDLAVTSNIPGLSAVLSAGSGAGGSKITNLGAPDNAGDATNKQYVDNALANKVSKAGDTMTGHLSAPAPTADNHVATRGYVNSVLASASGGGGGGFATCYYAVSDCTPPFNQMASSHRNDGVDHNICCYVDLGATQNPVGAFGFQDLASVGTGSTVMSDIQQVTDVSGLATASISGQGLPEFRICYTANCSSVLSGWAASTRNVQNNLYIQMRTTAPDTVSSEHNVTMNIGAGTDLWNVTTAPGYGTSDPSPLLGGMSNIIQFDHNYSVGVTGESVAQYRICSTANCSSVVQNWTTSSSPLSAGQYAQLRVQPAESFRNYNNPSLTLDGVSHSEWSLGLSAGYFVMADGNYDAALGGLSGASATCLSRLNATNWMGKADAQARGLLVAGNVSAFLCDRTTCSTALPNRPYIFARMGSTVNGGAQLMTDENGSGPSDTTSWSGAQYFGVSDTFWSNRTSGTATVWSNSPQGTSNPDSCSGFSTNTTSTSYSAWIGSPSGANQTRWRYTSARCNALQKLVCIVHP